MSWAVFVNLFGAGMFTTLQDDFTTCLSSERTDSCPGILTLFVPQFQVSSTTHPNSATLAVGNSTAECDSIAQFDTLTIISDGLSSPADWGNRQAQLLGAFVCFATLSFLLIFFFVPETKLAASGRKSVRSINYISLEELNHIFKVHTRDFIRWQLTKVLPYQWEIVKYLLGVGKVEGQTREKPRLEVMHIWAEDRRDNKDGNEGDGTELRSIPNSTRGDVNEVQRAYNPSPNDRRRVIHIRGPLEADEIRRVPDEGDGSDLGLPNPPYQDTERAGSIDWDPSEHPSPEVSPTGSRTRLPSAGYQRDLGGDADVHDHAHDVEMGGHDPLKETKPTGESRAVASAEDRAGGSQQPLRQSETQIPTSDDNKDTTEQHAEGRGEGEGEGEQGENASPPRIRRKPLPGNSSTQ